MCEICVKLKKAEDVANEHCYAGRHYSGGCPKVDPPVATTHNLDFCACDSKSNAT